MRMPSLNIAPDLAIHYIDENSTSQSPVILLHGLGVNCNSWQLQIPALTDAGFRVLAPDLPGFGETPYTRKYTNIAQTAAILCDWLAAVKLSKCYMVGISMGGVIALQFALDHPSFVVKLVLVNTFASLKPDTADLAIHMALRFIIAHILGIRAQANLVARRMFPYPTQDDLRELFITQVLQANPKAYRAVMRALAKFDVNHRLHDLSTPTLVISGGEDKTVPLKIQKQLVTGMPNAQHQIIGQAGHAVTIDQAALFNHKLLAFLSE